jgi:hypothetical protein
MEIQQSKLYQSYIESLGWSSESIGQTLLIYRRIPLVGTIAKIQRPERLPDLDHTLTLLKKLSVRTLAIEPGTCVGQKELTAFVSEIKKNKIRINPAPFLPTKTIRISLSPGEEMILQAFSEAKRRGLKKARRLGVSIKEDNEPDAMISAKNRAAGIFGSITTYGIAKFFRILPPEKRKALVGYLPGNTKPQGSIFLIFWNRTAWYWIAGATRAGKKFHLPTALVYHALLTSKRHGMKDFDFVGVWDERMPHENRSWLGFTKFKEGFGGKPVYYPVATL